MNLFAGFMANPELLGKSKEFGLSLDDFPEKIHKLLYGTMYNMYHQGITEINPVEIDTYISTKDMQYRLFNDNNGLEILYKLEEIGTPENFSYHYQRIKKFSFLRKCVLNGIDVSDILDITMVDVNESERQQREFDMLTLDELIKHLEEKIVEIKDEFRFSQENQGAHMSEGVETMLEELYEAPSYGISLASGLLTRLIRGARKKKFVLRSAPTGHGKSRYALADLCAICIPEIWDLKEKKWVNTGAKEKGLFITTELTKEEIQLPALCYISGVPEWKVKDMKLTQGEKDRMNKAVKILKDSNLFIEHLNDFDIEDIESAIERNVIKNGVDFVIFDYIHTSIKLLANMTQSSRVTMREDQVLLLMSDKIKQMCNKYDIWILSGTQLNNSWKDSESHDASSLRGARSLGDKLDVGMMMMPILKEDEKILETIRQEGTEQSFGMEPNTKIVIFKNRDGQYTNVTVWLNIDLGNLRTVDLFVTDSQGRLIPDITPVRVKHKMVEPEANEAVDAPKHETKYDTLPDSLLNPQSNEPSSGKFNF